MIQSARLVRNGNSLAVNLPTVLLQALRWTRGELLLADVVDGALRLRRVDPVGVLVQGRATPTLRARLHGKRR